MIRFLLVAAALTLAACGNRSVMEGMEEETPAASIPGLGAEVHEQSQTLPSGLEIQFTRRGANQALAQPTMDATVLVHYEGSLVDNGEVFDSSFARGEPVDFPLARVVPGFAEAITHMRPGDELIATFPGSLGYGAEGSGPIPPNAALRFRIALLAFQEPGGQPVTAPQ
ncbi:MAG: FKBP-type peptidyl-prolyl cis-trans isomerase [Alphaproteobacteria bacterium]|nr:FKBP-type peptidyl-prolyl cis-trans isomerase [Alphaproteobacteria bacterium]